MNMSVQVFDFGEITPLRLDEIELIGGADGGGYLTGAAQMAAGAASVVAGGALIITATATLPVWGGAAMVAGGAIGMYQGYQNMSNWYS